MSRTAQKLFAMVMIALSLPLLALATQHDFVQHGATTKAHVTGVFDRADMEGVSLSVGGHQALLSETSPADDPDVFTARWKSGGVEVCVQVKRKDNESDSHYADRCHDRVVAFKEVFPVDP